MQPSSKQANNILSGTFQRYNTHTGLFLVTGKYHFQGRTFLELKFPMQQSSPSFTIALEHYGRTTVEEGDKIEFEPMVNDKTGEIVCHEFFEDEKAIVASEIKYWKSNVVSMTGWERLRRPKPQTQFAPRPR